jgi:Domain of unknown function (DUF4159)
MSHISREQFLKLVAAGGASFIGVKASAQEGPQGSVNQTLAAAEDTQHKGPLVPWARLKFIGEMGDDQDWHVHPHGDLNLIDSIRDQTSLNIEKKWCIAEISDLKSMVQYPFLFMHGEIAPTLSDTDRQNLREYLLRGGFLFAEDCVCGYLHHGKSPETNDFFFRAMKPELDNLIPGVKLEQLQPDHPLFHCFYHFDAWPHMQGVRHGPWGLTYKKRLVALLSPSDLHCGWTNARWFEPGQGELAMQMGANIYLYAMTQTS